MSDVTHGLLWAALMIGLALATNAGLVERDLFKTMMIVLPIVAVFAIGRRAALRTCEEPRA